MSTYRGPLPGRQAVLAEVIRAACQWRGPSQAVQIAGKHHFRQSFLETPCVYTP